MKNKIALTLLFIAGSLRADTLVVTSVVAQGEIPYYVTLNGVPYIAAPYTFVGVNRFGTSWDADVLTVHQAGLHGYFSTTEGSVLALRDYSYIGVLESYFNPLDDSTWVNLQKAIYDVTKPGTYDNPFVEAYLAQAAVDIATFNYSDTRFVETATNDGSEPLLVAFRVADAAAAPEPASVGLFLSGLGLLALVRRRRK